MNMHEYEKFEGEKKITGGLNAAALRSVMGNINS